MAIPKYAVLLLLVGTTHIAAAQAIRSPNSKPPLYRSYEKYIDAHADKHLAEFQTLVSFPTISSIPSYKPEIDKAAAWIVDKLKSIGLVAQAIPTDGNPVVYGAWNKAAGKPTVLIYAHYDVQPVKESEWVNPPFAAKIDGGKIFGRGVSDDKAGVMTAIWAVEAMLTEDKNLPMNVKFIFDGEEEIGSPNFRKFLATNKELLKTDFALNADAAQFSELVPSIWLSLRGGVQLEFAVKTADLDAHSGAYGGKTPNAAVAMAQIISSFYTREGNVAVEGFYDKVLPLSVQERAMIKKIPYNKAYDMKVLGTTAETGDSTYTPLERIWYRPTLEIIGLESGYTAAEGFSNIVPGHAMARITCRTVSDQSGPEIIDLIVKHINKNCPVGATITFKFRPVNIRPVKFPSDTRDYKYISDALTGIYGTPPLQTAVGGGIGPLIDIKEELGVHAYSLGFQMSDEKWHSANEFVRVSSLRKGQLVYCYYFQHVASEERKLKK